MNAAVDLPLLPDIRSLPDSRALALEAAGIRPLKWHVRVRAGGREPATVAAFSLSVALPGAYYFRRGPIARRLARRALRASAGGVGT